MDIAKLILTGAVSPPTPLPNTAGKQMPPTPAVERPEQANSMPDAKKVQVAKDFESILLNKLFDEMRNTIGQWGSEEDGTATQVQGIFWWYLSQDVANKGGIGLWKDIYNYLTRPNQADTAGESLDKSL